MGLDDMIMADILREWRQKHPYGRRPSARARMEARSAYESVMDNFDGTGFVSQLSLAQEAAMAALDRTMLEEDPDVLL